MTGPELLLYDADPRDLDITARVLRARRDFRHWPLSATSSRRELLDIAARRRHRPAVVLIDLKERDQDVEFAGLRLVRTIAAHPRLRSAAIPVALTLHARADVARAAAEAGAGAVVHRRALDLDIDVGLAADFADLAVVRAGETPRPPLVLPRRRGELAQPIEAAEDVWASFFVADYEMTEGRRLILRAKGRHMTNKEIARHLLLGIKTLEVELTKMNKALRPNRQMAPTIALQLVGAEFLERCPQVGDLWVAPSMLPPPHSVLDWQRDAAIKRAAWNTPEDARALTDMLERYMSERRLDDHGYRWPQTHLSQPVVRAAMNLRDAAGEFVASGVDGPPPPAGP